MAHAGSARGCLSKALATSAPLGAEGHQATHLRNHSFPSASDLNVRKHVLEAIGSFLATPRDAHRAACSSGCVDQALHQRVLPQRLKHCRWLDWEC